MTEWERMTVAAVRLAEAWVEFWSAVEAYGIARSVAADDNGEGA